MEARAVPCPNCGAGFGALEGGEYRCAYCGHRWHPPELPLDPALVARAVAKHEDAQLDRQLDAAERMVPAGFRIEAGVDPAAAEKRTERPVVEPRSAAPQATVVRCPNCGAGLGAPKGGEYSCAYCGHRSLPPEPPLDQARQDELVARAVAKYEEARFGHERAAAETVVYRAAMDDRARRAGDVEHKGRVAVRALCFLWTLAWLVIAGCWAFSDRLPGWVAQNLPSSGHGHDGQVSNMLFSIFVAVALPPGWVVVASLVRWGLRRRALRLHTRGLRGRAIVVSYYPWDGVGRGEAMLRVELLGRPPFKVLVKRDVTPYGRGWAFISASPLFPGAELPVLVDPRHPEEVTVDWDTAVRMKAGAPPATVDAKPELPEPRVQAAPPESVVEHLTVEKGATLDAPHLTSVRGFFQLYEGSTANTPLLASVGGFVQVREQATWHAPILASVGGYVRMDAGAVLDAPLLAEVGGYLWVPEGADLDAPLLHASGKPGMRTVRSSGRRA